MFGIGPQEIITIVIAALIIFGPQRLPEIAAQAGKALRDFRRMKDELTGELRQNLTLDDPTTPARPLTDTVAPASATPEGVGSAIAQSLRVETIPTETITPTPTAPGETSTPTTESPDEDTMIGLDHVAVATKAEPLIGVSALDSTIPYVGATYPAKAPAAPLDSVYTSLPPLTNRPLALDAEPATTGEADTVRAQGGIADAWAAAIHPEATSSPARPGLAGDVSATGTVPPVAELPAYAPPQHEPVVPHAEPTMRETIEAQVAAEAFRERRRLANYQRARKRD